MNEPYRDHPSEDALERFLFHHSDEEELEMVEEHFLACEICVNRLEVMELNIAAAKRALREDLRDRANEGARVPEKPRGLFGWLSVPQLSFAGAALAACALAITFVSVPREIQLVAERGTESATVAEWVPLHMHLQARELQAGPVTVRLVNKVGKQVWEGAARVKNEEIEVTAPRLMSAGSYLVQVYAPSTAGEPVGDLVREYSITAKPAF